MRFFFLVAASISRRRRIVRNIPLASGTPILNWEWLADPVFFASIYNATCKNWPHDVNHRLLGKMGNAGPDRVADLLVLLEIQPAGISYSKPVARRRVESLKSLLTQRNYEIKRLGVALRLKIRNQPSGRAWFDKGNSGFVG